MSVRVGVLGAGTISSQYLGNLTRMPDLEVTMVADLNRSAAQAQAAAYGIGSYGAPAELLSSDVELIVNLTPPAAHMETTLSALEAGKLVWCEKPVGINYEQARRIESASEGWKVGCAPDTVLGWGAQTWLRQIRDGVAGPISSGFAAFTGPGPQGWHPAPEFLFAPGGGPLKDMGPYYITWLVHALGPVVRVSACSARAQATRVIGAGPRAGTCFDVAVPTTHSILFEMAGGAHVSAIFSFDNAVRRKYLELTGELGTIVAPDPNKFDGEITISSTRDSQADPFICQVSDAPVTRGLGALEMVRAIAQGRIPRASIAMAAHVVEVLDAVDTAAREGAWVDITSTVEKTPLLDADWDPLTSTGCSLAAVRG